MNTLFDGTLPMDVLIKGILVLAAAALIALTLRRSSAAVRHLVWTTGVVGLLLLPVLTLSVPRLAVSLPVPVATDAVGTSATAPERVSPTGHTTAQAGRTTTASTPVTSEARPVAPVMESISTPAAQPRTAVLPTHHPRPETGFLQAVLASAATARSLGVLWLVGALWFALLFTSHHLRIRRLAQASPRVTPGLLTRRVETLTQRLGVTRPVAVRETPVGTVPMTSGVVRPTLFLPADADTWPADRLDAVLVHELAHVRRFDHLTQTLAQVACALYWFNPLTWIAARNLRRERELACDDLVLASGSRPSSYAEHLVAVAKGVATDPAPSMAAIAFTKRSQLGDRISAILEDGRRRGGTGFRSLAPAVLALALVTVPLAALDVQPGAASDKKNDVNTDSKTMSYEDDDGTKLTLGPNTTGSADGNWVGNWHEKTDERDERVQLRAKGELTWNDELTAIIAISKGGYFKAEQKLNGVKRRIEIHPDRDGSLDFQYKIGGDRRPYDDEARTWFGEFIQGYFLRTGAFADKHVAVLLEKGGPDAVFAQIEQIGSDYAMRRYFVELQKQADMNGDDFARMFTVAGDKIGSDYELTTLLVESAGSRHLDVPTQLAYVNAARTVGSDYEQRRALTALLDQPSTSDEVLRELFRAADDIGSDYEQAEFLLAAASVRPIDSTTSDAYFDAVRSIGSDYEQRRVLTRLLKEQELSSLEAERVLEAATDIGSDYELAEMLVLVARNTWIEGEMIQPFFRTLDSVGSDHEHARVLNALLDRREIHPNTLEAAIDSGGRNIGSDYELAEFLVAVASKFPMDKDVQRAYRKAVESIGSRSDRERAQAALEENGRSESRMR